MATQTTTQLYHNYYDRYPVDKIAIYAFNVEAMKSFIDTTTICPRCADDAVCHKAGIMAKGGIRLEYHCPECGDEFVIEKDQSKIDYLIQGVILGTP